MRKGLPILAAFALFAAGSAPAATAASPDDFLTATPTASGTYGKSVAGFAGRTYQFFEHPMRDEWLADVPAAERAAWSGHVNTFVVSYPKGDASGTTRNRPLYVALHSSGEGVSNAYCRADVMLYRPPEDFYALYLDCRAHHDQDWWWSVGGTNSSSDYAGKNARPPYATPEDGSQMTPRPVEQRVLATVRWAIARYGIDPNRVYLCGISMGGSGALGIGLNHGDVFAAVKGSVPAGVIHAAARLALPWHPTGSVAPCAAALALPDPPVCVDYSSTSDQWGRNHDVLYAGMAARRYAFYGYWGMFAHGDKPATVLAANDLVNSFEWTNVVRNAAYAAFTRTSCDSLQPRWYTADEQPAGQVNAFCRFANRADTATRLEMELFLATPQACGSTQFSGADSATTDVTLRRLQNFPRGRGQRVRWTFGDAQGLAVIDELGVYTIPALRLTTARQTLALEPVAATEGHLVVFRDVNGVTLATRCVADGGAAVAPAAPVREGDAFAGWDRSFDCVREDLTVTATYGQAVLHTVTFVGRGGQTLAVRSVADGMAAEPPDPPAVEGMQFREWDRPFDCVKSDLTVTAVYTDLFHVIFQDFDFGLISDQWVTFGASAVEPAHPTHAGKEFVRWAGGDFTRVVANLTLTAEYEEVATPPSEEPLPSGRGTPVLVSPTDGAFVRLHSPEQKLALASGFAAPTNSSLNRAALPVRLCWTGVTGEAKVTVALAADPARIVWESVSGTGCADVYNCFVGEEHVWTVRTADAAASGRFVTELETPRIIYESGWNGRPDGNGNMRDEGGYRGLDGRRVRQGLLYRSARFDDRSKTGEQTPLLDDYGLKTMTNFFGVKTDLDLRGASEAPDAQVSGLGSSVRYVLVEGKYQGQLFASTTGASAQEVGVLLDTSNYPLVFHCKGGKDRTGVLAFLALGLLGVEERDLYLDYVWTVDTSPDELVAHVRKWDEILSSLQQYPGERIVDKVEGFVRACGYDDADIAAYRDMMLEPPMDSPPHWHDWAKSETVAATCAAEGREVHACSGCGDSVTNVLPKISHEWGAWHTVVEPTLEAEGVRLRRCVRCPAEDSRPIERLLPLEVAAPSSSGWGWVREANGCCSVAFTNTSRTWQWKLPAEVSSVEFLVVGGGGSGGFGQGGGGGAGGVATGRVAVAPGATIQATVGAGGLAVAARGPGDDGRGSSLRSGEGEIAYAFGGGGGGWFEQEGEAHPGRAGGSGGGGGYSGIGAACPGGDVLPAAFASAVEDGVSCGRCGGAGFAFGKGDYPGGGGGGGAQKIGGDSLGAQGGAGGDGLVFGFAGEDVCYAGGGGAACNKSAQAPGGQGGGGTGGFKGEALPTPGVDGLGGGGGGAHTRKGPSGAGGSGIVIIRYAVNGGGDEPGGDEPESCSHQFDDQQGEVAAIDGTHTPSVVTCRCTLCGKAVQRRIVSSCPLTDRILYQLKEDGSTSAIDDGPGPKEAAALIWFKPTAATDRKRAIVIFPGGGYSRVEVSGEGCEVARQLAEQGYTAVVCWYRGYAPKDLRPMADARAAMRAVRAYAQANGLKEVGVCGFSAGGHLASYQLVSGLAADGTRPDFAVLGYPCITCGATCDYPNLAARLGATTADAKAALSTDLAVADETTRTFLYVGLGDATVPAENSLRFADALKNHGVRYRLKCYAADSAYGVKHGMKFDPPGLLDEIVAWIENPDAPTADDRGEDDPGGDEPVDPPPDEPTGAEWGTSNRLTQAGVELCVLSFTNTAEKGFVWTVPNGVSEVSYLVVGGGGGGGAGSGNYVGGGGGGGFAVTGTVAVTSGTDLTIRVGAGGAGGASGLEGENGVESSLDGGIVVTAAGGGAGGGGASKHRDGKDGGCGGGAAIGGAGGAGDFGGNGAGNVKGWGGSGGGAIGDGGQKAGSGGAGLVSAITGGEVEYACGGVGAGQGVARKDLGTLRTAGCGGAGGSNIDGEESGASGGDGVVVIRYRVPSGVGPEPQIEPWRGEHEIVVTASDEPAARAAAIAAILPPADSAVSPEQYRSYFTVVAAEPLGGGAWRVTVALDGKLAPSFAADGAGRAIGVSAAGVALAIANAEPGLWYGVAAAADLESLKTAAAGSWKQCAAQGTLTWTELEPPSREGGFYRVVVSEGGSL